MERGSSVSQGEAGGGAHRRGSVGIDVFGAGVVAVTLDGDGLQVFAVLCVGMAGEEDGRGKRGGFSRVHGGILQIGMTGAEMSF